MTTRARLTQLDGKQTGKVFPLDRDENKLGRLPGLEVPLEGDGISREHALIRSSGGRYTLLDTGSRNGCYVNGRRVKRLRRLKDGDEISIGEVTLRFTISDAGPQDWTQSETVSSNIDALLGRLAQPGASSPAMLVASSGAGAGKVFRLDRPRFVLGRDDGADGQIHDAGISRRHAIVSAMAGDTYVLEDLGSSNGTFANQERVDKPYILRDGDMIQLGSETVLRFVATATLEAQLERTPESTRRPPRSKAATAEIEEKELERELALARKVQMTMVPPSGALFDTRAALFVGSVRSASFAAGDLWTHVEQASRLLLLVADVTGHGVGPAMITTVAKSCLDTVLLRAGDVTIEQAFDTMNRVILGISKQALVMTAFAVEVDPDRQQLSYCSAGHIPQVLLERREGGPPEVTPLFIPNTAALGQSPESRFEIQRRDYQVGDRLVLFTDGLLEAENSQGSAFGNRRLHALLRDSAGLELKELLDVVLAQVDEFAGGAPPADDVTVVALELRGRQRPRRKTSPGFARATED